MYELVYIIKEKLDPDRWRGDVWQDTLDGIKIMEDARKKPFKFEPIIPIIKD